MSKRIFRFVQRVVSSRPAPLHCASATLPLPRVASSAWGGLLVLAALCAPAAANEKQDPETLAQAVENFARKQTAGLPGQVTINAGSVDTRLALAPCPALVPFLPSGSRLWGNTTVGVRCNGSHPWTIYVPVSIRITGSYLVTARPVARGQTIGAEDLTSRVGDLTQLPPDVLSEPALAVGKTVSIGMAAGQPLRQEMLRAAIVIQQGQTVELVAGGRGFRVSAGGKAVAQAADGQVVQVRVASGKTISGIARAGGVVEVAY